MLPFLAKRINIMEETDDEVINVYVVIKYLSTNQLGKRVVARGPWVWGRCSAREEVFMKGPI
jgi:hypothetical protein